MKNLSIYLYEWNSMKKRIYHLVNSDGFNNFIVAIILVNCILIGVETFYTSTVVTVIQDCILGIYIIELFLRWIGRRSVKSYFSDGWNYFDIFVVAISLVPSSGAFSAVRALRILRIFKTLRQFDELRLISIVLLKSLVSLAYTGIFFLIFMYIYAVIGVTLFKFENYLNSAYFVANDGHPDPYGTLGETFFTLFRMITGEGWDALRYNLMEYSDLPTGIITFYHVSWVVVAAFLLLNLVVGVILNNFDQVMKDTSCTRPENPKGKQEKYIDK